MTGKEHTIFKSYHFYTLEEEKQYREDIANWMNECTCKDDGSDYNTDDYSVFDRMLEDIWECYDIEKANLNKELPNNIIAIGKVGRWDGKSNCYKVLGNNLNEILYMGKDHQEINCYCDRYNVHSELVHHDGTDRVVYRLLKEGVDVDTVCEKILEGKDVSRYTVSLVPFVQACYGF